MRYASAVVTSIVVWNVTFIGLTRVLHPSFAPIHSAADLSSSGRVLALLILVSFVASILAGATAAKLSHHPKRRGVWVAALGLLAVVLPFAVGAWDRVPVWYNVLFHGLLIPLMLLGGRWAGAWSERTAAP